MMVVVWSAFALGVRAPARTSRYDARERDGLPAPVQRYFRAVLKDGQLSVTVATVQMASLRVIGV